MGPRSSTSASEGPVPIAPEQTAVESAINSGVLVVAAAGNGAINSQFGGGRE